MFNKPIAPASFPAQHAGSPIHGAGIQGPALGAPRSGANPAAELQSMQQSAQILARLATGRPKGLLSYMEMGQIVANASGLYSTSAQTAARNFLSHSSMVSQAYAASCGGSGRRGFRFDELQAMVPFLDNVPRAVEDAATPPGPGSMPGPMPGGFSGNLSAHAHPQFDRLAEPVRRSNIFSDLLDQLKGRGPRRMSTLRLATMAERGHAAARKLLNPTGLSDAWDQLVAHQAAWWLNDVFEEMASDAPADIPPMFAQPGPDHAAARPAAQQAPVPAPNPALREEPAPPRQPGSTDLAAPRPSFPASPRIDQEVEELDYDAADPDELDTDDIDADEVDADNVDADGTGPAWFQQPAWTNGHQARFDQRVDAYQQQTRQDAAAAQAAAWQQQQHAARQSQQARQASRNPQHRAAYVPPYDPAHGADRSQDILQQVNRQANAQAATLRQTQAQQDIRREILQQQDLGRKDLAREEVDRHPK